MDHRLIRASHRLSESPIAIDEDGFHIEVYWFRAMMKQGEWYIKRHAHGTYEFHFCARGDCVVETDDDRFTLREGFFYLSRPGVYHTQYQGAEPEFIEYSLNCAIRKDASRKDASRGDASRDGAAGRTAGAAIDAVFNVFQTAPCVPVTDRFGALDLFNQALEEAERQALGCEWNLRCLIPQLLVAAARSIERDTAPLPPPAAPESDPGSRMARIEAFVRANLDRDIGPEDVARHVNLSARQVARVVAASKGYSTKKFITRSKLRRAKELLSGTDRPIKEIAASLGFSSEHYFNMVFKLHEGVPPGMFRTSTRGTPARDAGSGPAG